jgi:hypothetical protein
MIDDVDPAMLVVGRDVDGSWTVRERAGLLLGRFCSVEAAQRFAWAERHGRAAVPVATAAGTPPRIHGRLTLGAGQKAKFDVARG